MFISALGLELLSLVLKKDNFHQSAWHNYLLAVLAAIAAVLSALIDGESLKHSVFYIHRALGWWTLAVAILSSIGLFLLKMKSPKLFKLLFLISLIIMASLVAITGYYGGRLVYEYGVGVEE
ncbi:MAG: DUF2231 domain-containing protein [Omnitrophica bacterium]|nr:DUF2231 domain-containing protein [Candidatus Omnitrophota bacterium]